MNVTAVTKNDKLAEWFVGRNQLNWMKLFYQTLENDPLFNNGKNFDDIPKMERDNRISLSKKRA